MTLLFALAVFAHYCGTDMIAKLLLECGGILVVLYVLLQVFRDIFHPTASGSLSDSVGYFCSVAMRHTRFRPAVGLVALVTTILCWVAFLVAEPALARTRTEPNGN